MVSSAQEFIAICPISRNLLRVALRTDKFSGKPRGILGNFSLSYNTLIFFTVEIKKRPHRQILATRNRESFATFRNAEVAETAVCRFFQRFLFLGVLLHEVATCDNCG